MQKDNLTQQQPVASELIAQVTEVLPEVLAGYPVVAAYVYGSAAWGKMTAMSDLDIALVCSGERDGYRQLTLDLQIQAQIEDALGFAPVDVRTINEAPLMVKGRIVQEGVRVYEGDHHARVAFEVAARKRYYDYAPKARELEEAFIRRVHEKGLLNG